MSDIHFRSYLAQVFLKWEMFQTSGVQKSNTRIKYSKIFKDMRYCGKVWQSWTGQG
jgi:hypothetical protein